MARLVYAKDNKIMMSEKNIPTANDVTVVESVEALKAYKLIYEAEGSKENTRIIMGSTEGIPTDSDATIYKKAVENTESTNNSTTSESNTETPSEESNNESTESVDTSAEDTEETPVE